MLTVAQLLHALAAVWLCLDALPAMFYEAPDA
jgi:hypothetical protein